MLIYRIQKEKFLASALTGEGARRAGGRWNPVGVPLVYAATSPELALLETLVHLDGTPLSDLPPFVLLTVALPDDLLETLDPAELPAAWAAHPYPDATAAFLLPRLVPTYPALAFALPSAVLPGSPGRNVLLNPLHPRAPEAAVVEVQPLLFDARLRPPSAAVPPKPAQRAVRRQSPPDAP